MDGDAVPGQRPGRAVVTQPERPDLSVSARLSPTRPPRCRPDRAFSHRSMRSEGLGMNGSEPESAMDSKQLDFDIVEVMACPGGCVGGGGQPLPNEMKQRRRRMNGLHVADARQQIRVARDNVLVCELYDKWLREPNSEISHQYLHTHYHERPTETEITNS